MSTADSPIRMPPHSEAKGVKVVVKAVSLDCAGADAQDRVGWAKAENRGQKQDRSDDRQGQIHVPSPANACASPE